MVGGWGAGGRVVVSLAASLLDLMRGKRQWPAALAVPGGPGAILLAQAALLMHCKATSDHALVCLPRLFVTLPISLLPRRRRAWAIIHLALARAPWQASGACPVLSWLAALSRQPSTTGAKAWVLGSACYVCGARQYCCSCATVKSGRSGLQPQANTHPWLSAALQAVPRSCA